MLNSGPNQNYLNSAPNVNYLWASLIVEELDRLGIDTFCIAPGSRSAPLAMAVAGNGVVKGIVHYDERGAAFHALGHAKATGRPAVFICSSGTAVANALPAVVEAGQSFVPLILLTADRPPELLDTGANQAILQQGIYGPYVRWSTTLPCPDTAVPPEFVLTTVDQAVYRATSSPPGPVHINCMFREPLAPVEENFNVIEYTRSIASWFDGAFTQYIGSRAGIDENALRRVRAVLTMSGRGLLVVGALNSRAEMDAAQKLAEMLHWPVLPDVASGLRLDATEGPYLRYADRLLLSKKWKEELASAQVIVQIGGPVTSKNLLHFLQAIPSRQYVRIADHPCRHDPGHRVSHRLEMKLDDVLRALESNERPYSDGEWNRMLVDASESVGPMIDRFVDDEPTLSEIAVARIVSAAAPGEGTLFLGNSMPIRDMDLYGAPRPEAPLVAVNRGASGIDGNIATAAGYADALRKPVTMVLGDLAFLHDLNSLSLAAKARQPFVIVVINNDGGGIFSFLPIAEKNLHFERYFGTPHGHGLGALCEGFGVAHVLATSKEDFAAAYTNALTQPGCTVIEARTDREHNRLLHRELEAALVAQLG